MKDEGITPAALIALITGDIENAIVASTPGGIEAQEAAGQVSFVADQTLPIDCPREDLEALGFLFGENVDDVFVNVKFPKGWTKEATDHSMWSDLKDSLGNVRGGIFYKAAFYDRNAALSLVSKISYSQIYAKADKGESFVQYRVFERSNGDTVTLFETKRVDVEKYSDEYFEHNEKQ